MPKAENPLAEFEAEQTSLVSLCKSLTDEQWSHASLCSRWTVRQTVVHVAWHIHRTPGQVIGAFVSTPFYGSTEITARQIARDERRSTQSLIEWLARPGKCNRVNFGELLIHQQDIRRPLGLEREVPPERVRPILDLSLTRVGSASLVPRASKRAAGLRFVATDMAWSSGDGPEVHGTAEAILMAINGRRAALPDLAGPGVTLLGSRQPAGNA
jgi:uncharacterized protein (TIGR03083 family)